MATPLQRNYEALKSENPTAVLFFQLGDFYELFTEDALLASRILNIRLTCRHKGSQNETPMCGFPKKAAAEYLKIMVNNGYKVAIADQIVAEDGTISRAITRVVSPGANFEPETLENDEPQYLLGIIKDKTGFGLAYTDATTGEFKTAAFRTAPQASLEILKIQPKEILLNKVLFEDENFMGLIAGFHITPCAEISLSSAEETLKTQFSLTNLTALGLEHIHLSVLASALVLKYLKRTQKTDFPHLETPKSYRPDATLQLDPATLRHLEIFTPLYGEETNTTFWACLKKPITAAGKRMLRQWMLRPLTNIQNILERQEASIILEEKYDIENTRETLKQMKDIERLVARISTGRVNGRDLVMLRDAVLVLISIQSLFNSEKEGSLGEISPLLQGFQPLLGLLEPLKEDPPLEITQGGLFNPNFDAELDEYLSLSENAETWLANYLEKEKKAHDIPNIRAKFSKSFGYSLEISKAHTHKAPEHWERRQTLVNAERFITPELKTFEEKALSAEENANIREYFLFTELRKAILPYSKALLTAGRIISQLDCLLTFAKWKEQGWNTPKFNENGTFMAEMASHPVVEKLSGGNFVKNTLNMTPQSRMHLITGPNMAGKSTFLRQNALIILLGQMGAPVPAKSVNMPIFDRIFTRVGASDHLAGGKSTFFVEMSETARILRSATAKTFVILDEIGRGTSTYDGLSLAWAIMEDLHTKKAFTLFATHYHELTELAQTLKNAENFHITVAESENGIVFLRQIKKGGAKDSFGIEVAKLAGVPNKVIDRAKQILVKLEQHEAPNTQKSLFTFENQTNIPKKEEKESLKENKTEKALKAFDLNNMTPMQAFMALEQLKKNI